MRYETMVADYIITFNDNTQIVIDNVISDTQIYENNNFLEKKNAKIHWQFITPGLPNTLIEKLQKFHQIKDVMRKASLKNQNGVGYFKLDTADYPFVKIKQQNTSDKAPCWSVDIIRYER